MNQIQDLTPTSTKARKHRKSLYFFIAFLGLLILAALFLPMVSIVDRRSVANESSAAARIRFIQQLQGEYSSAHPKRGFACELALLQPAGITGDDTFSKGMRAGYKFEIVDCEANGAVRHYHAVAAPLEPGVSGVRAFCGDESGEIWYDADGSGTKCLASRRRI